MRERRALVLTRGVPVALLLAALTLHGGFPAGAQSQTSARAETHSLWVHPPEVGRTPEAVRAFVAQAKRAHIETIIVVVKGMNGELYWPSRRFAAAVVKGYETFDMLGELTRAAHAEGIKVHAWLCDFVEGVNGAAFRAHPEWAQLNPSGGTTATETLGPRRRPYPYVWMCPARRPGYTDQWLLPMIEELVRTYPIDGIHHDYVRYPGDVAPDSFCFDDFCLREIPRYAMLAYESRASERYPVDIRQERVEANWWTDPTMLPPAYSDAARRERADFLLNGRTIPGGPADVRHFFYDYRVAAIDRFVREAHALVKKINPKIELSAAVFKNPVQSARFIGQRWHEWNDWIDVYTPMTYRSHFAGSFDAYLDHLEETTRRQIEWVRGERPIEAGIASTYLFREELKPIDEMTEALDLLRDLRGAGAQGRPHEFAAATYVLEGGSGGVPKATTVTLERLRTAHGELQKRLAPLAPSRAEALRAAVETVLHAPEGEMEEAAVAAAKLVAALRADLPEGFCPPEKLARAIDAARRANPAGIAIFAAGSLEREKLWPALEQAFAR